MEESKVETKPDVKLGKRKLKMEDYPEFLAKRHTDFQEYRYNCSAFESQSKRCWFQAKQCAHV